METESKWDVLAGDPRFETGIGPWFAPSRLAAAIEMRRWGCETVLDLGCGTGITAETLRNCPLWKGRAPPRYYGVESSWPMRQLARARASRCELVGDVACLSIQSFDCVLLRHVLEHQEDPSILLDQAARRATKIVHVTLSPSSSLVKGSAVHLLTADWKIATSILIDEDVGMARFQHPFAVLLLPLWRRGMHVRISPPTPEREIILLGSWVTSPSTEPL